MDINANNLEDSNLSNYSNFLKLSSALRKLAKRYHIDTPKEQMVVEAVLYSYLCDETLIVFDLILNKNIASQATIHATMKSLIKKDLIKLIPDKKDGRVKLVLPTRNSFSWVHQAHKEVSNF